MNATSDDASLIQVVGNRLKFGVRVLLACFVFAVWTMVGFLFWIPLIARTTTAFSMALVHANLAARKPAMPRAAMDHAVSFYIQGYATIFDVMFGDPVSDDGGTVVPFKLRRFLLETLVALLFWSLTLFVLGRIGLDPTGMHELVDRSLEWIRGGIDWIWARARGK